jgi:hypothetical protein
VRLFRDRDPTTYPSGIEAAGRQWRYKLDAIPASAENVTAEVLQSARTPDILEGWACLMRSKDRAISTLHDEAPELAERSRPIVQSGQRAPVSRVIALWRDAIHGEIQSALDPGDNACVLSLECQMRTEYCADGRSDRGQSCYPVYAGYRSFQTGPESRVGPGFARLCSALKVRSA